MQLYNQYIDWPDINNLIVKLEKELTEEYQEFVKSLPQGRMPIAEEFVPMLFLLASSESKIMSGSLISMDGAQGQAYYNYSS